MEDRVIYLGQNDKPEIKWVHNEYIGRELVFKGTETVLSKLEDLKVGMTVYGWWEITVQSVDTEEKTALGIACYGALVAHMEYDKDNRHCWVHDFSANLKGVNSTEFK
jgi:hypothetical protein